MTECIECGFVYEDVGVARLADILGSFGERYQAQLLDENVHDALIRRRPALEVWSALEYACHFRDVLLVQRDRTVVALVEDCPGFPRMYRDERVQLARYADESPGEVGRQLAMAADLLATVFGGLSPAQLRRPCIYTYPEPATRDVAWLGRHTIHEGEHHLLDLQSVLARARQLA